MIIDARSKWHDKITDAVAERLLLQLNDWTHYYFHARRSWQAQLWAWIKGDL